MLEPVIEASRLSSLSTLMNLYDLKRNFISCLRVFRASSAEPGVTSRACNASVIRKCVHLASSGHHAPLKLLRTSRNLISKKFMCDVLEVAIEYSTLTSQIAREHASNCDTL